jgi:hypothetical protein
MLVKVFNNLWPTSTAKVTILSLVFSRRNILDFLSYKSFPDLRVRVRVTRTRKPEPWYLNLSNNGLLTEREVCTVKYQTEVF